MINDKIRLLEKYLLKIGYDRVEEIYKDNEFILYCYNTKLKEGMNLTIENF